MDQFCTHFVVNGMQTGSLRYSRLGNLRYDEAPFRHVVFMRALYHEFIWKLRCGQIDCDMSGQEVTQGDRSGHFFVKFRLTVFRA
jgi:hypothetical protein